MKYDFLDTVARVAQRSTSAVVARHGTKSAPLRAHLNDITQMRGAQPFVREPFVESAHGYVQAEKRMEDFVGGLLRHDVVDALDGTDAKGPENRERYRFQREWRPFKHQVEAWEALTAPEPQSLVVTSGTGSGKTECFLVPLLNDLARQAEDRSLVGVQAIMLYPLNALINSQKERLSDWLSPFEGRIRFALFNGETKHEASAETRRLTPEEVIDRKALRDSPPPVLVTNITMLEYMLIRFEDSPILEKSRGKLKYIVLDEAHTYVGSQAAELSLLLRRVLSAFDVSPEQVRFVATSATIGKSGDEETREGLGRFLAQVAGIPRSKVTVIEGVRQLPELPPIKPGLGLPTAEELSVAEPEALYSWLGAAPSFRRAFNALTRAPLSLSEWTREAGAGDSAYGAALLKGAAMARRNGEPLLPLRIHAFHRVQPGAWACINPACEGKKATALADPKWAFGSVLLEKLDKCPYCSARVLEIKFCSVCEEVALAARLVPDDQGNERLSATEEDEDLDEFFSPLEATDAEGAEGDGTDQSDSVRLQATPKLESYDVLVAAPRESTFICVDPNSGRLMDEADGNARFHIHRQTLVCPYCKVTLRGGTEFRSIRQSAPFMLGNIVPELLDDASPAPPPRKDGREDLRIRPADGRVLLMFTDSRQGTARLAANLQRNAEQNHVRSFIYHTVQAAGRGGAEADKEKLAKEINNLRDAVKGFPALKSVLDEKEAQLLALGKPQPIAWEALVTAIAQDDRIDRFIRRDVWEEREREFARPQAFANFLLLREFLRPPVRGNSAETMGLATLRFERLDLLAADQVPSAFAKRGGTLSDWKDFLYLAVMRVARQNWCASMSLPTQHWISHRIKGQKIVRPARTQSDPGWVVWPGQCKLNDRRQIVQILAQGLGLSLGSAQDRADIDECFAAAWNPFIGVCQTFEGGFRLDFTKASIAAIQMAYACPAVGGLFRDRAFRGLSPVSKAQGLPFMRAEQVRLPTLPFPFAENHGVAVNSSIIKDWLSDDEDVRELRKRGLWSDLHDRIAQFSVFFRTAEHSAQQAGGLLKHYESEFKAGRVNVLSCSTTMEMGVDIGSISTVAMTNVPPSIASYRQRVGRAGRRGQEMALSFTLCKNTPLDRAVFRDPRLFLERTIYPPTVALDSAVISQRHVNATLLGRFLAEKKAELHKVRVGAFFGFDGEAAKPESSPSAEFETWLDDETLRTEANFVETFRKLLVGTPLEAALGAAIDAAKETVARARTEFQGEWQAIFDDIKATREEGGKKTALTKQMKGLVNEYLLADLAGRGFLPGYGFPTDVVNFDNVTYDGDGRERRHDRPFDDAPEKRFQIRGMPSRQLDLAIRDYAPGSDVVIDGRVYQSAGIKLSWKRPVTEEGFEKIENMGNAWRCGKCGAIGTSHASPSNCPSCGSSGALIVHRFLKPGGFACDPNVTPHDKVETVAYVAPKAPWIAAHGGEWSPLSAAGAGRSRSSRDGLVFHYTLGAQGHGYAICLACGRAEPETKDENEGGPPPAGMAAHRPLKRKKTSNLVCEGVDPNRAFTIQRRRALGYQIRTDVFELQLDGLHSLEIALPIAAAFRDSLASKLGVEADEMGVSASPTKDEVEADRWSILVFDKAPGGAGFSVAAAGHVEELLAMAAKKLDCPQGDACRHGCPECIMCKDIQHSEKRLNRLGALALMKGIVKKLALPLELAVLGAGTLVETRPVADAVMRAMMENSGRLLRFWLADDPGDWNFGEWPLLGVAQRLAARGRKTQIVLAKDTLALLDESARLELYGNAARAGCEVRTGPAITPRPGFRVLAWVGEGSDGMAWVSSPGEVATLTLTGPLVCKEIFLSVPAETLLKRSERMAVAPILKELDVPVQEFGRRFWELLSSKSDILRERFNRGDEPTDVEYVDRYLNSPLPVRLLREVLVSTPKVTSADSIRIDTADAVSSLTYGSSPMLISHDWRLAAHRDSVIRNVLQRDFPGRASFSTKPKRLLPHGRILTLRYATGVVVIRLDQGFGYWGTAMSTQFPFSAELAMQTSALVRSSFKARASSFHETVAVVTAEK